MMHDLPPKGLLEKVLSVDFVGVFPKKNTKVKGRGFSNSLLNNND